MGRYKPAPRRPKVPKRLGTVLLVLAVLLAALIALDRQLRPVIVTMAQYQCRVISLMAINEAVAEELSEMEDMEPQLVRVEKNADDTVSAIEVNSTEVNQLKNRLIAAVSEKLMEIPNQDIHIPLGTLLGWQLLAGRGPDVQLQVVPASYVRAEINDSLTTAGINQTEHKLFIDFTVEMSAILPGYSTDVTVTDEVCIAQTMIIGPVPQVYASHTSP